MDKKSILKWAGLVVVIALGFVLAGYMNGWISKAKSAVTPKAA